MRNLYQFILKYIHVFLFIILEAACFYMIYQTNGYQQWVINGLSKEISGPVLKFRATSKEYFQLKKINQELQEDNRLLIEKTYNHFLLSGETIYDKDTSGKVLFEYIEASVIENTTNQQNNYIILDKGTNDGIAVDMGVVCRSGIVGVVKEVSPNFCVVLSLLSSKFSMSIKIQNHDLSGILYWDGEHIHFANIKNISSIEDIKINDTILTQHSLIFPSNYPIGQVSTIDKQPHGGYYSLKIKLFNRFDKIDNVWIVKNNYTKELNDLKSTLKDE